MKESPVTYPGSLVVLEGIDGSGKTSCCDALNHYITKNWFNELMSHINSKSVEDYIASELSFISQHNHTLPNQLSTLGSLLEKEIGAVEPLVCIREPGGTPLSEQVRCLLKGPAVGDASLLHPVTQFLLFMAARSNVVRKRILPALKAGAFVLCDRYFYSSIVHQHLFPKAKGIEYFGTDPDVFDAVLHDACADVMPDAVIFLDVDPAVAHERLKARDPYPTSLPDLQLLAEKYKAIMHNRHLGVDHYIVDANDEFTDVRYRLERVMNELITAHLNKQRQTTLAA